MSSMGVKVREKVKGSGEYWIFINHDNFRIYGHYIPKTSTRRGVDVLDERKEMER